MLLDARKSIAGRTPMPATTISHAIPCPSASTTELTASLLALEHGKVPATLNYEEPDARCPVSVIKESQPVTKPYVVKVSFTELGQCAAAVLKKW